MEILSQLANVDLKELLSNGLEQNFGLQLNWQWDEKILGGQNHEVYYVKIKQNDANAVLLQHFINKWMQVYEQLSLHHDYFVLRSEMVQKKSYNVTVQLEELMNDVHTPRLELWMNAKKRGEVINQLDDSIFEETMIPKRQLSYLAINALSTKELYSRLEQKMAQYEFLNNSPIEQNFQIIRQAIHQYNEKQEIEILYSLTDKLEEFYIWLKGLFTAINNQLHRGE